MVWRIAAVTCALVVALVGGVWAQATVVVEERGTVARLDSAHNVIVLEDGRAFRLTPNTVILVDNQPATQTAVRPGANIVIRGGEVVTVRNGQYVVAAAPAAPPAVGTTVTAVPATRQTVYGKVTDVDNDGEVTIKTAKGELEVRFSPDVSRAVKEGDTVQLDLIVMPPGSMPAASPALR
jgi:phage gp45-like